MVYTTIEIDAPPSKVRSLFLDFPNLHTYHTGFVNGITPLSTSFPSPVALEPGNKLHIEIGPPFVGTITQNTPDCFAWQGPPNYGLVSGRHTFRFEESVVKRGGTRLVQSEEFKGYLWWLMSEWLLGRWLKAKYEGFNEDLKRGVERGGRL